MRRSRRKIAFLSVSILLPAGLLMGLWSQRAQSQGTRKDPVFLGPPGSPAWYKMQPEDIPDYLLWREFFDAVALHSRFGNRSFTLFLGDRVGLTEADALKVLEIAKEADARRNRPLKGTAEMQLAQRVRWCRKAYYDLEDAVGSKVFALIENFLDEEFRYSFQVLEEDSDRGRRISALNHSFSELSRQQVGAKIRE